MKSNSGKSFAALAVVFACTGAQAATYYFANCDAGAASGCVAGNDSNVTNSATTPWRSIAKLQSVVQNLNAGDTILLAKGGAWTSAHFNLANLSASASNPITIDSYTAAWGSSAKPKLTEATLGESVIDVVGGSPDPDGGYVVRNLDLQGAGTAYRGVLLWNASNLTLENVNIEGFAEGIECAITSSGLRVLNSTFKNNARQGILSSCSNSLIQGNQFDNNGFEYKTYYHSIYLDPGEGASNIVIRGNTITNNAMYQGKCDGVAIVAHGQIDNLLIENNHLYQPKASTTQECWGIGVDAVYGSAESFTNVVIRGNTLVGMGNVGIGCGSCVSPLIENNVIVLQEQIASAIKVPDIAPGSGDAANGGATIRNNSIYFDNSVPGSIGISLAYDGVSSPNAGSNLKVVSNLIYFGGNDANRHCFDTGSLTASNFTTYANNLCYLTNGQGGYSPAHATLALAQSSGGFDANGKNSNPLLVAAPSASNSWSMAVQSTSPAINAGHPSQSAPNDKSGNPRVTPDIGAYESQASSCTSGPAWVRIANEYRNYTVPSTNTVRFGNGTTWLQKSVTSSGSCTAGSFTGTPPAGTKWCELQNSWTTASRIAIGHDYQTFTIPTAQTVYYGNSSGWTSKAFAAGTFGCSVASFNNVDPAPGAKRCEILVQPASCSP